LPQAKYVCCDKSLGRMMSKAQKNSRPRFLSRHVALSVLGLVALAGFEPLALAQGTPSPVFVIKGFNIQGENPLPEGETSRVLAPFLRTDATLDSLQKATQALEATLKDKGFALHRVVLPPQEIGATVTLNIVKFVIGKVTVEGLKDVSEANVRASVPELQEGSAPNFRRLSVQTTIANESPAKQIQVSLKEADEADQINANIVVKESKPWSVTASLANTGSSSTGNDRLTLAATHANVFGRDHQFTGAYTTSTERPADVRQIGLNYRVPLYRVGGVLGLNLTKSDVVGNFGAFSSTGAGQTMGLSYSHYLPPSGGYRGYISLGLDDKLFKATEINGVAVQSPRRSQPLSLGYNARIESDSALWGYSADLVFNIPGGSDNSLTAYLTEDARITTANWRALKASANYLTSFSGGWLWSLRGQLQYSPDALISGEQFGLGGATSVRGTGERPISGDSGILASTEISTRELAQGLRLLGFVDAGWLANNNANGNPKPTSDRLASVGLGLRYNHPAGFALSADYGRVVTGSVLPFAPNSGIPQNGDQKFHINFSARF
jgi:hemolysin activation/secretion protein